MRLLPRTGTVRAGGRGEPLRRLGGKGGWLCLRLPVHFAAPCGDLLAFKGRLFYSAGRKLAGKPAASVVSCRRGGATAALDAINKFYPIMGMPMVPSQYWNMVHGIAPQDVLKDEEGLQIMRNLGVKMAWMLRSIQAGRQAGVPAPVLEEPPLRTNLIR